MKNKSILFVLLSLLFVFTAAVSYADPPSSTVVDTLFDASALPSVPRMASGTQYIKPRRKIREFYVRKDFGDGYLQIQVQDLKGYRAPGPIKYHTVFTSRPYNFVRQIALPEDGTVFTSVSWHPFDSLPTVNNFYEIIKDGPLATGYNIYPATTKKFIAKFYQASNKPILTDEHFIMLMNVLSGEDVNLADSNLTHDNFIQAKIGRFLMDLEELKKHAAISPALFKSETTIEFTEPIMLDSIGVKMPEIIRELEIRRQE